MIGKLNVGCIVAVFVWLGAPGPAGFGQQPSKGPEANAKVEGGGVDAENGERVLVIVNGEELTEEQAVNYMLRRVPNYAKLSQDQVQLLYQRHAPFIAAEFVGHVLLKEEAKKVGIVADDKDVERVFADYKENPPSGKTFEQALEERGLTEAEMREKIKEELAIPLLLKARLGENFTPEEKEVEDYYQKNGDKFTLKETVHARHILIKVDEGADDKVKQEKRKEMDRVRSLLLKKDADFAKLAEEYSDCPSKEKGGDLGTFSKGRMVKEFEQAAFTQQPHEIGEVIETRFGFHVLEVLEHNKGGLQPLEDVQDQIVKELEARKRGEATKAYLDKLKESAKIEYPMAKDGKAPRMPRTIPLNPPTLKKN